MIAALAVARWLPLAQGEHLPPPTALGPWVYVGVLLLTLLAGAGGQRVLDWLRMRADSRREDLKARAGAARESRRDAADQYEALLARQGADLAAVQAGLESLAERHRACERENGRLLAMVEMLGRHVAALRASGGRGFADGPYPIGVLVVGPDGTIEDVGEYVLPILHHHPADLVRRHVREVIPARRHPILDGRLAAMADPATRPDPFEVLAVEALARGGEEVPVLLRIVPWVEGGKVVAATLYIQERPAGGGEVAS